MSEKIGFTSALLIGIGAIVGGGIFVLGGVAIAHAGPGAIPAFLFNGLIALVTARSFAGLVKKFPESGGAYVYAKRILSLRAAFVVGWMLWLAHLVAALLYAMGFAAYFSSILSHLWDVVFGVHWAVLDSNFTVTVLAAFSVAFVSYASFRRTMNEGVISNLLKIILMLFLIGAGLVAALSKSSGGVSGSFLPFLPLGAGGMIAAMGYTFIAFQGFELIAASAGEIKNPTVNVPKAMYASLLLTLVVYLPLLAVVIGIGIPRGATPHQWCAGRVETCMADAAGVFLGSPGYWIVSLAAVFATLSALNANIAACARLARTMANDRSMPRVLGRLHERHHTPEAAIAVNFVVLLILLAALHDTAAAGAAASLAFLISYALTHGLGVVSVFRGLERQAEAGTKVGLWGLQIVGLVACIALAAFQITVEHSGGVVLLSWVCLGSLLYYLFLSQRAEALDAFHSYQNPSLLSFRGINPVALVPVSNPQRAAALASLAHTVVPRKVGRILLLSVAPANRDRAKINARIAEATRVVSDALSLTVDAGRQRVEGIISVNKDPWRGIDEVARTYRCETLLLGLSESREDLFSPELRLLLRESSCNIIVLNSPPGWTLQSVARVLIPVAGKGAHDQLRARIVGSLNLLSFIEEIAFIRVLSSGITGSSGERVLRALQHRVADETAGKKGSAIVEFNDNVSEAVLSHADDRTLVMLGIGEGEIDSTVKGSLAARIAKEHRGASLIIRRGTAS